jgi:hypothetical protein
VSRQAAWRVGLPDWRLPAGAGGPVLLDGATRLLGPLRRPAALLPAPAGEVGPAARRGASPPTAAPMPGATVRLLDQEHLGLLGTVREGPRRRLARDLVLAALEVELPAGVRLLVPLANVEVVQ